jgi:polyhydroxyalkanoate synthesis regulator phasin
MAKIWIFPLVFYNALRYNAYNAVRYKLTGGMEMTTQTEQPTQPDEPVKRTLFYELSRKVLLAAIGAAAVASDEISVFVAKLAERGEIAENDARKLIRDVLAQRQKLEEEQKAEEVRGTAAADKAQIDALNARIAELSKRIEELKKAQEPAGQRS